MTKLVSLLILFLNITTSSYADTLYSWSQLAPNNKLSVRAITSDNNCPQISTDVGSVEMIARFEPNGAFPHKICQATLGQDVTKANINNQPVALVKNHIQKILLLGDTGCGINEKHSRQICTEIDQWPFPKIAELAAATKPDLIIHMGDYHYRTMQCKNGTAPCDDSTGLGWGSWLVDFFQPAQPLLNIAPWVMIRGNHEDCSKAWQGWNSLFDLEEYQEKCQESTPPYLLKISDLNLVVFDSAASKEHAKSKKARKEMADIYLDHVKTLNDLTNQIDSKLDNTWLLTHKPIWSPGYMVAPFYLNNPYNETLRYYLKPELFTKIGAIFNGHVHLSQLMSFTDKKYPAQIVIGNGGNDLLSAPLPLKYETEIDKMQLQKFLAIQKYGYGIMERTEQGWKITLKDYNDNILANCNFTDKTINCET